MLDSMYMTMSISSGLYPNLDLWNANKLQLQLQLQCSADDLCNAVPDGGTRVMKHVVCSMYIAV